MKDEVLQEVWKAKDDLAARHNYDVHRLAASLMVKEGASGHEILDLHARKGHRRTEEGLARRRSATCNPVLNPPSPGGYGGQAKPR